MTVSKISSSSTATTEYASTEPGLSEFIAAKLEKKKVLASGYTQSKRNMELLSASTFTALLLVNCYLIYPFVTLNNSFTIVVASVCGILMADFISGFLHWAADTWGTTAWPLVCLSVLYTIDVVNIFMRSEIHSLGLSENIT
jgi:hypothetical protein